MRKVYVNLNVNLTIFVEEGQSVEEVINELDYSFIDTTDEAQVENYEITDYEIVDSK